MDAVGCLAGVAPRTLNPTGDWVRLFTSVARLLADIQMAEPGGEAHRWEPFCMRSGQWPHLLFAPPGACPSATRIMPSGVVGISSKALGRVE